MISSILVPRENANDDLAMIVFIEKSGIEIKKEQLIFELKGSKAVVKQEAPCNGYFFAAYEIPDAPNDQNEDPATTIKTELANLTATMSQPAAQSTRNMGSFPLAAIGAGRGLSLLMEVMDPKQWDFVGSYDYIHWQNGYPRFRIGKPILGPVDMEIIADDFMNGVFDAIVIAVSTSIPFRQHCYDSLRPLEVAFPNFIHSSAVLHPTAELGEGNMIVPNVHIVPFAKIGSNNFISSFSSIEHHCYLQDNNTFGPGTIFSGSVTVGSMNEFEAGIYIKPLVSIGDKCQIASGCIITKDIPAETVIKTHNSVKLKAMNS